MKERFQKTWPYFLFLMLTVCFSYLWLVKDNITTVRAEVKKTLENITVPAPVVESAPISPVVQDTTADIKPKQISKATGRPQVIENPTVPAANNPDPAPEVPPVPKKMATLNIDGLGNFGVEVGEGINAFEMLKKAATEQGFSIDYVYDSSWGAFITKIAGVGYDSSFQYSSPDGKYWFLYINGNPTDSGVSFEEVVVNDNVEWQYKVPVW